MLAHFILEKSCGIAVVSLADLEAALENLTEKVIRRRQKNARRIERTGRLYLVSALKKLND